MVATKLWVLKKLLLMPGSWQRYYASTWVRYVLSEVVSEDSRKMNTIRLSEKFLSFYKEIIDAQCFLLRISLLNYART